MSTTTNEDIISMEFVISPDSRFTPAFLHGAMMKLPINVRETCSGIVVRGKRSEVESSVNELRKIDPYGIFVKARGSRVGLHRIYRGFLQIEGEYKSLPAFSHALKKVLDKSGSKTRMVLPEKKEVTPEKLSQIVEKELSEPKETHVFKGNEAYVYPIFSKYRNFDIFWVCRDKKSINVVAAGSTREEVTEKAKKIGYTKFYRDYPSFSISSSDANKLECARMVICQCAPSAVDVDAVLILRKDGTVKVHCPLGDMCNVWCPYGEVELAACNRTKEASRLILIRGTQTLPKAYVPKAARGAVRYFLMTDRKGEWTQRNLKRDKKEE